MKPFKAFEKPGPTEKDADPDVKSSVNPKAAHGKLGEDAAADWLKKNGYCIKARNVRIGHHELDIIAEDDDYIVFVEVKTRTEAPPMSLYTYGRPASAVNYKKKQNIIVAAEAHLRLHPTNKRVRIDVIEVYLNRCGENDTPTISNINHIRNAFGAR